MLARKPAGGRLEANDVDDGVVVGCSGRSCKSCSGVAIADCVALCCCPCGVVSLAVLLLVKVPWAVGTRWMRRRRTRRRMVVGRTRGEEVVVVREVEEGSNCGGGRGGGGGGGGGEGRWCAGKEAERVWLELHQSGELGFGRVSLAGVS